MRLQVDGVINLPAEGFPSGLLQSQWLLLDRACLPASDPAARPEKSWAASIPADFDTGFPNPKPTREPGTQQCHELYRELALEPRACKLHVTASGGDGGDSTVRLDWLVWKAVAVELSFDSYQGKFEVRLEEVPSRPAGREHKLLENPGHGQQALYPGIFQTQGLWSVKCLDCWV